MHGADVGVGAGRFIPTTLWRYHWRSLRGIARCSNCQPISQHYAVQSRSAGIPVWSYCESTFFLFLSSVGRCYWSVVAVSVRTKKSLLKARGNSYIKSNHLSPKKLNICSLNSVRHWNFLVHSRFLLSHRRLSSLRTGATGSMDSAKSTNQDTGATASLSLNYGKKGGGKLKVAVPKFTARPRGCSQP